MADPVAMHALFTRCGLTTAAQRNILITNEGFDRPSSLAHLETDTDVFEMAKRLSSRTAAEGRINLGTVVIKNLQALAWWIRDKLSHGEAINHNDFTAAALQAAIQSKRVDKDRSDKDTPKLDTLKKFDPIQFETHEDAFVNYLSQIPGSATCIPLRYIVRDANAPANFVDEAERRLYQIPMAGTAYTEDNKRVYRLLKSYLAGTPGIDWIEAHERTEDGRAAWLALTAHYNGSGELSKRVNLAQARLRQLYYKNEKSLSFESFAGIMTNCFRILNKDENEKYTELRKVKLMLELIKTSDPNLISAKAIIAANHMNSFTDALNYFSSEVSRLHAPAQLEHQRGRTRQVSAIGTDDRSGRGRARFDRAPRGGRGRYGGRGRGDDRRGDGRGRGHGKGMSINNVDISDPFRNFSSQEWTRLGREGQTIVWNKREKGRGGGRGQQSTGRRMEDLERRISAFEQSGQQQTKQEEVTDKGTQNGRGFGRGAYNSTRGRGDRG